MQAREKQDNKLDADMWLSALALWIQITASAPPKPPNFPHLGLGSTFPILYPSSVDP
jgi:hypothetical protein